MMKKATAYVLVQIRPGSQGVEVGSVRIFSEERPTLCLGGGGYTTLCKVDAPNYGQARERAREAVKLGWPWIYPLLELDRDEREGAPEDALVAAQEEAQKVHHGCLQAMSRVLNLSQDLEDIYNDACMTSGQKVQDMLKKAQDVQVTAAGYLGE